MNMIKVTKAKLIIDGKECEVMISPEELEKLFKLQKKTGYERVHPGSNYFYVLDADVCSMDEDAVSGDDNSYKAANYYSDRTVAENNARADKLMRQLRRFAVEHRESDLDWTDDVKNKYYIGYNHYAKKLSFYGSFMTQDLGVVYFDLIETVELAIKTFHDELIWYFTEYKDSL